MTPTKRGERNDYKKGGNFTALKDLSRVLQQAEEKRVGGSTADEGKGFRT